MSIDKLIICVRIDVRIHIHTDFIDKYMHTVIL